MTGSSVQIGGVLFGGVPDLAGGAAADRKNGHGKPEKGSKGAKGTRVSFLGRIFGSSSRQKGKADDRSTSTSNRVSEAPAEFLPVPCPPEPSELDSPVISPRPEASGEEESRSLQERLRAAETHKGSGPAGPFQTFEFHSGDGPAGPVHAFESYVIASLTRKQRRPALDLAALAAASENGGGVELAERDTWQGSAGCEGENRGGEGVGLPEGSYRANSQTEEGSEATSIRPGGSVDGEGSFRNMGGRNVQTLEISENVVAGNRLEQGTCSGAGTSEGLASHELGRGPVESHSEGGQETEGLRGGEWLAASRPLDEHASGRPKEFYYERRASSESPVGETVTRHDTWHASEVSGENVLSETQESSHALEEAAGPSYAQESSRGVHEASQNGSPLMLMEGGSGRSGNTDKGRRKGERARGGIEWGPMKDGGIGRSDVVSGGVESRQRKAINGGRTVRAQLTYQNGILGVGENEQ